jgi:hypothetical protein
MQPSTTSGCHDSIQPIPWDFSNWPNNQARYGNFLRGDSVSVQETSYSDSHDVFQASDDMDVDHAIHPMNLDMNQGMEISPRSELTLSIQHFGILNLPQ